MQIKVLLLALFVSTTTLADALPAKKRIDWKFGGIALRRMNFLPEAPQKSVFHAGFDFQTGRAGAYFYLEQSECEFDVSVSAAELDALKAAADEIEYCELGQSPLPPEQPKGDYLIYVRPGCEFIFFPDCQDINPFLGPIVAKNISSVDQGLNRFACAGQSKVYELAKAIVLKDVPQNCPPGFEALFDPDAPVAK